MPLRRRSGAASLLLAAAAAAAMLACRGSPSCDEDDELQADAGAGCPPLVDAPADLVAIALEASMADRRDAGADGPTREASWVRVDAAHAVPPPY